MRLSFSFHLSYYLNGMGSLGRILRLGCAFGWLGTCLLLPYTLPAQQTKAQQDSIGMARIDSIYKARRDSATALATRIQSRIDSTAKATEVAIALRDTVNHPRPLRPEQIRADRREHLLAAGGVVAIAALTFLLYNLRTH